MGTVKNMSRLTAVLAVLGVIAAVLPDRARSSRRRLVSTPA